MTQRLTPVANFPSAVEGVNAGGGVLVLRPIPLPTLLKR